VATCLFEQAKFANCSLANDTHATSEPTNSIRSTGELNLSIGENQFGSGLAQ